MGKTIKLKLNAREAQIIYDLIDPIWTRLEDCNEYIDQKTGFNVEELGRIIGKIEDSGICDYM